MQNNTFPLSAHCAPPSLHINITYVVFGSTGPKGNKSVGKCVCRWKQVKMKQKDLLCAFTLSFPPRWACCFNIAPRTCLSPCLSACLALYTLCGVLREPAQCYYITLFRYIVKNSVFSQTTPAKCKFGGWTQQINSIVCMAPNHNQSVWQKSFLLRGP
jgi:hypothetical protein